MNAPFTHADPSQMSAPPTSRRILALHFPYLATDRTLRRRHGRSWRSTPPEQKGLPLALSHRDRNAQRIAALDEEAERLGLKCGMGLTDARAMYPGLDVVEADPEADRRLLEALADWCDRYTPLVALEGTDGLFLDISGCAHLFGGEARLLGDVRRRLTEQGFAVGAALASTPGAAWAAARHRSGAIVEQGGERPLLEPLPLAALRLEPSTRSGLESVGLRTAGAIFAVARPPLARRFGSGLIDRIDQALGHVEEAISPRLPVAELSAERHLAEPIGTVDDIEQIVLALAGRLENELSRRGEGARSMELALFRVDGVVTRIAVGMSKPMRAPPRVTRLFHERLATLQDRIDAGFGFDLLRLSVNSVGPVDARQTSLHDEDGEAQDDLSMFADRVVARLGRSAVFSPHLTESHIPERAARLMPFSVGPVQQARPNPATAIRPIRLFDPAEPVDVMAEVPEGPPMRFRWRRALYQIVKVEGPERIAPEWWLPDFSTRRVTEASAEEGPADPTDLLDPEEAAIQASDTRIALLTRDYFRIEDSKGHRYWLYREGLYDATPRPRWYLQGLFA